MNERQRQIQRRARAGMQSNPAAGNGGGSIEYHPTAVNFRDGGSVTQAPGSVTTGDAIKSNASGTEYRAASQKFANGGHVKGDPNRAYGNGGVIHVPGHTRKRPKPRTAVQPPMAAMSAPMGVSAAPAAPAPAPAQPYADGGKVSASEKAHEAKESPEYERGEKEGAKEAKRGKYANGGIAATNNAGKQSASESGKVRQVTHKFSDGGSVPAPTKSAADVDGATVGADKSPARSTKSDDVKIDSES